MKKHSEDFKQNIKQLGRELDNIISYSINDEIIELGNSELNSITPVVESALLKSVMKELDIDSNVDIPIGTSINYKFGVSFNNSDYEYIDFGNYIVYSSEKQENTNSYNIICYDRMLASMVEYENLKTDIQTFPMTIRDYIDCICADLGLFFKNKDEEFVNYNKIISFDLYANIGYTYRDILDELSQVTASNIIINENDEIEIKYINETNDTIDEEYLKDVNIQFGEKYGPINSIVLSRAANSDKVYLRDEESVEKNGICEINISENQIMNFNNRRDYLPEILQKLDGLEYYINDFLSTGVCYYDVCDKYNVKIGNKKYSCILFNDEIQITQGLKENIYTDIPEQAETDYTKADKTDRKINQTNLIVDKQNQTIEGVVSNVTEQNEKISKVTQTVNEINSKISEIADITISGESTNTILFLDNINQSEPIQIKIKPISENISYLYPRNNLYPSSNLYLKPRKIIFENLTTNEIFPYELPDDLLYYNENIYDEFILDYGDGDETKICQVIKRCKYNEDGTVSALGTEYINDYPYPTIALTDGDYKISLPGYNYGYLFARLMAKNIYTTQFATKVELNSEIRQTRDEINLKVSKNEVISEINQSPEQISISANKINLNGVVTANENFKILEDGSMMAKNGEFNGSINLIDDSMGTENDENKSEIVITDNSNNYENKIWSNAIKFQGNYLRNHFWVSDSYGSISVSPTSSGIKRCEMFYSYFNDTAELRLWGEDSIITAIAGGSEDNDECEIVLFDYDSLNRTTIKPKGITTPTLTQTSLESNKKNIEKYHGALEEIKNTDIYKYNLKNEKDDDKKHVGFVIGDKFKYSNDITSQNDDKENVGVDIYSFVSVCCQAIKEQQEQIEELKNEISKLKEERL